MFFNRTLFALVFASVVFLYTAMGGQQGLTIDPDGAPRANAAGPAAQVPPASPLSDQGLTIDPDGRSRR
jgi:hypothetical protein